MRAAQRGGEMRRGLSRTRVTTLYMETYFSRAKHVTQAEALSIAQEASCIYAVEQGEIEIPSFENQRRLVCTLRFERIVPAVKS